MIEIVVFTDTVLRGGGSGHFYTILITLGRRALHKHIEEKNLNSKVKCIKKYSILNYSLQNTNS